MRKDISVLDLSNAKNVRYLRNLMGKRGAPQDVMDMFDLSWIINDDGKITSTSILSIDVEWVNWICEQGFRGYVADSSVGLHPESFVCDWEENLLYLGSYDNTKVMQAHFCGDPYYSANSLLIYI